MTDETNLPQDARCFRCGTRTQTLRPDESCMDGATAWYTSGNYGSQVIDGDGIRLEIHLCDVCLLLGRERVLQYKTTDRDRDRVYETWDPPGTGLDPRRRVLVVWEDEHGRYCVADHKGGALSGLRRHDTLREVFEQIQDHDVYMRDRCTAQACRDRILERSNAGQLSPLAFGYAFELVAVLGHRFSKGEFWCEHSDDPNTVMLTVVCWPGVRLAVAVRAANSDQRVLFEIYDWHEIPLRCTAVSTIQAAIDYISTYRAPSPEPDP
jgi:hypothetical protein